MLKIPAIAYFCLLIIVAFSVIILPSSFPANLTIGSLVMVPLLIELYNVGTGKYPRVIKYLIFISLFVMFFMVVWTVSVLAFGGPDQKSILPSEFMSFHNTLVAYYQTFFFLSVFIIDCQILKIFSVITTWIKERRVVWFRNGGIIFIALCVIGVVFAPQPLSSFIASGMGVLVFIFDNILSIYLVISLIRLKKLNIEMGSVADAVSILVCIVLVDWFSVISQITSSKGGNYVLIGVTISSLFSLHFCLAVNAFSLIKELALFKKVDITSLKTTTGMGITPVKSMGDPPLSPIQSPGIPPAVGEKSTIAM